MREALTEREVEFLLAYADCDMRTTLTARALGCHKATVPRIINRIFRETGFNPAEFWDLFEIMKELEKEESIGRPETRG